MFGELLGEVGGVSTLPFGEVRNTLVPSSSGLVRVDDTYLNVARRVPNEWNHGDEDVMSEVFELRP